MAFYSTPAVHYVVNLDPSNAITSAQELPACGTHSAERVTDIAAVVTCTACIPLS